jgi:hypothetical protein
MNGTAPKMYVLTSGCTDANGCDEEMRSWEFPPRAEQALVLDQ